MVDHDPVFFGELFVVGLSQFNEPLEHLVVHWFNSRFRVKLEKANKEIIEHVLARIADGDRIVGLSVVLFLCVVV